MDSKYGKLVGIHYYYYNFSSYGSDEEYKFTTEKLENAMYLLREDGSFVEHEKKNQPITGEQWKQIDDAVAAIFHLMNEKDNTVNREALLSDINEDFKPEEPLIVWDGRSRFKLTLYWDNGKEITEKDYYRPDDRRFCTLLDIMREIANPIGREIKYYGEPIPVGIYVFEKENDKNSWSFQCTLVNNDEPYGPRYFFCHLYSNGVWDNFSPIVYEDTWQKIYDRIMKMGLCEMEPLGFRRDEEGCTLYLDDGKQPSLELSKMQRKELKSFFMELMMNEKNK